jgi:hypothetical protein
MNNENAINEVVKINLDSKVLDYVKEAGLLSINVMGLTISNGEEYKKTAGFLQDIKGLYNILENTRKETGAPLLAIKRKVDDFLNPSIKKLVEAESILKRGMKYFNDEQKRKAQIEQRKAEQKARELEEKKMAQLKEKAEKEIEKAKKEEEKGNVDKANRLKEKAQEIKEKSNYVHVPVVITQKFQVETVSGISIKKNWFAQIKDFSKVPKSVYINDPKVQQVIQSLLNRNAKVTKGSIPMEGVEFLFSEGISSKSSF